MIHCGRCLPEGAVALAINLWKKIPYLCYVHGEELNCLGSSRELSWLLQRVLARANCVIANSSNTARIVQEKWGMPASRVRLLHPGVDTTRFVPATADPAIRSKLGWGDRPVVLTVGRLQKRKGQDTMIRALRAIRKTIPDILYAVVGDGEERRSLEAIALSEGVQEHVRFHGELDDRRMLECYQQCDLFVLANRQVGQDIEGFGIVLLEAQACGKPVIAGNSGGTAETMRLGDTGYVVSCNEIDEIVSLVPRLLGDSKRLARMGDAGRRWVTQRFDWDMLARQAERIFGGEQPMDIESVGVPHTNGDAQRCLAGEWHV
jgi:phosphatidylinositol alpha-1,6-mannosyltransferase